MKNQVKQSSVPSTITDYNIVIILIKKVFVSKQHQGK